VNDFMDTVSRVLTNWWMVPSVWAMGWAFSIPMYPLLLDLWATKGKDAEVFSSRMRADWATSRGRWQMTAILVVVWPIVVGTCTEEIMRVAKARWMRR
jgi:hypothetical protein